MDITFQFQDVSIAVRMRKGTIHLLANESLWKLVNRSWLNVEQLSAMILKTYPEIYEKPLRISQASLTIEILAHIYTYRICLFMRKFFPKGLFRIISHRACNIDCGEWGSDTNRWIWDMLSIFKPLFFLFVKRS